MSEIYSLIHESNNPNVLKQKYISAIKELLEYYNIIKCPCAFPRFRQIASVNFGNYGHKLFLSYDTEILISNLLKYYKIGPLREIDHVQTHQLICKKCSSVFRTNWEDFSINFNREYMELIELKTEDIGADIDNKIPIYLGYYGNILPDQYFENVDLDTFINYMKETKKTYSEYTE